MFVLQISSPARSLKKSEVHLFKAVSMACFPDLFSLVEKRRRKRKKYEPKCEKCLGEIHECMRSIFRWKRYMLYKVILNDVGQWYI